MKNCVEILFISISKQLLTYPPPQPDANSDLLSVYCYCWARGGVGAQ